MNHLKNIQLWGDGHTHSHWSDGLEPIRELSAFFKRLDLDFRFQSDHCGIKMPEGTYLRKTHVAEKGHLLVPENFPRYLAECRESSDGRHVAIPAIELDLDYGSFEANARHHYCHIKVHGFTDENQLPPEGWYKNKSLFKVLRGLKDRGLFVFLAHTNGDFLPWQDLKSPMFDGFELCYNMFDRYPPTDKGAFKCGFWDRWLAAGRRISISTGSDCHQADMACFSMRNVVASPGKSAEAIQKSFLEGKSYLSATWHPDVYKEIGLTKLQNRSLSGFACWFEVVKNLRRDLARPIIQKIIRKSLAKNHGRVKRRDHPELSFSIEGMGMGETVRTVSGKRLKAVINARMNVDIEWLDLVKDGEIIKRFRPGAPFFREEFVFRADKRRSYARLMAKGMDKNGRDEWLISNPIYLRSAAGRRLTRF
ncbi:MAG: hypothetical protein PHV34_15575 [Verrucomicrobiae bacterium]|nr:hypothetical protein [Verrucomicrobiae bacterium]